MKLSYIIVALATIAVTYAGSVDLKVQDHKITITPKAAPITALKGHGVAPPCRWPLVLHGAACKQSNNKDSCEKEDPVFGWAEAGACNDPGLGDGGWPVCCVVQTGEQFWYRKTLSCEYNGWHKCPETLVKAAPITAPPVKDPCHKIVTFRTEKPICIQQAYKGECPYLPDYASGSCAAAGFPLCCQGNEDKEQDWHEVPTCPAGTDVCPKNRAAPIMKLVKKNAKFQKLVYTE